MTLKNTTTTYGSITRFLHWFIFLLILGLLAGGFYTVDFADDSAKGTLFFLHKSFGLTVLWLMLLRIVWAYSNPKPGYSATLPAWQKTAARALHMMLYFLLVAMPISGWILSTAAAKPPNYFGLFVLNFPGIPVNQDLKNWMVDVHVFLAWTIIVAVSLHILAALKHHFVNRDDVLRRMLHD